jgi:hypothetical protein
VIPSVNVLALLVTYVEYTGTAPLQVQLCDSSNDAIQIWVNDQKVQQVSLCRPTEAFCSETAPAVLLPGKNAVKVLVWTLDGGWSFRLRLARPDGTIITDGDPEVSFGTDPTGYVPPTATTLTRRAAGSYPECARPGGTRVTIAGSGDATGAVTLVETIEGPFTASGITKGGVFTPFVAPTESPVGIFEDARDVGPSCYPGTTVLNPDGSYTVTGGGVDIWTGGDEFQFAYVEATGDFEMTARVAERVWAPGTRWGKVGIMARQDLSSKSRYIMLQTHGEDLQDEDRFAARPSQGGADNYEVTKLLAGEHRDWMRLRRTGSLFTTEMSLDGVAWMLIGERDLGQGMPATVLLGLAVNGHSYNEGGCVPSAITFDEVSIVGGTDPPVAPAPSGGTIVWNTTRAELLDGVAYDLVGVGLARFSGNDGLHVTGGDATANVAPPAAPRFPAFPETPSTPRPTAPMPSPGPESTSGPAEISSSSPTARSTATSRSWRT